MDGRTDMPDDVRARLIAATAELIGQRGPLGVRVDEIAEPARCSRATLYRYAADKDELVREVIVARTTAMAGIVAHQIEGISDATERIAQGMLLFADALRSESCSRHCKMTVTTHTHLRGSAAGLRPWAQRSLR
ncbi:MULTISPECIES: TetR/AcrR family transcriptional regulator [Mycobacterium]|uniref:TetR/AcrR family transcriptional regulator n=1 Tax=Mycobacterium TaxID=1763 RepID=UPI001EE1C958|nr:MULTISPECIES: TetR/AcrR family transcriptional regulator [Mycobacterium]